MIDKIIEKKNPSVLGLDTRLEYIPGASAGTLVQAAELVKEYNRSLIDTLYDIIPAVKVQAAYYEMYGPAGMDAFADACAYASVRGMAVIADCKRNDIGSTAQAYSTAYLSKTPLTQTQAAAFSIDMLTVNAYLGIDGIQPFLDDCKANSKGVFILVKTSNPSSGQLQDLQLDDGRRVYEAMADLVKQWGAGLIGRHGYSAAGAVVGATYPLQCTQLRNRMPYTFFLLPGYGAQGASAADLTGAFDENGLGAAVNASRSLICAYNKTDYAKMSPFKAARAEAVRMRDDILSALRAAGKGKLF